MRAYFLCLGACLVVACAPADRSGTVDAWVYGQENNENRLKVTQLTDLESLHTLTGKYLRLRRGAELRAGLNDLSVSRGQPFDFAYSFDDKGVVVPGDLHSFYAASIYQGFSKALTVLQSRGYQAEPLDVFYFPAADSVLLGDMRGQFTDNAAFLPAGPSFLIMPGMMLSEVPLMLSEGVAAHEYGHSVVQQELADRVPGSTETLNFASMNEGVADLIGFIVTGQTNFFDLALADRDLAKPRSFTLSDAMALDPSNADSEDETLKRDPHYHGSTMARSVFEAWPGTLGEKTSEAARMRMLDHLLSALREAERGPWLWNIAAKMISKLPASERAKACGVLRQRFAPLLIGSEGEEC